VAHELPLVRKIVFCSVRRLRIVVDQEGRLNASRRVGRVEIELCEAGCRFMRAFRDDATCPIVKDACRRFDGARKA